MLAKGILLPQGNEPDTELKDAEHHGDNCYTRHVVGLLRADDDGLKIIEESSLESWRCLDDDTEVVMKNIVAGLLAVIIDLFTL